MELIRMKIGQLLIALALPACVAGCGASLPGQTTGSLFGSKPDPTTQNDPSGRAFAVASTSARALKCGYNFDPTKLRYQYLASEAAASPGDQAKIAQIYDVTYNGVTKAIADQGAEYCSPEKTRDIKAALSRHIAGDYSPTPQPVEPGLFGSMSSSSSSSGYKQTLPMDNR